MSHFPSGVRSGGGMWGLPMSRGRVASLEDWLVKAPPSYANHETQPKALSRHWIGQDLRAPEAYGGRGRRETDVRDGQPGTTIRAPNAGQLDAHPRPHRAIGYPDARELRHVPAEEVIYSIAKGERKPPRPAPRPYKREACFYLGDTPPPMTEEQRLAAATQQRQDYRNGDPLRFTFGGEAPAEEAPPDPHQLGRSSWRMGDAGPIRMEPYAGGNEQKAAAAAAAAAAAYPRYDVNRSEWRLDEDISVLANFANGALTGTGRPDKLGLRMSDIHEGWQGIHRADPPAPAPNQFRRSASDITLGRAKKNAPAKRAYGPAADPDWNPGGESDTKGGVSHGRRRTEITNHEPRVSQMEMHGTVTPNGEIGHGYRHQATDIHLDNLDKTFRAQETELKMSQLFSMETGPKYGRRNTGLIPSDFDLLKV